MGRPHLTWMNTAMHDVGRPHAADRPSKRLGEPSTVPCTMMCGGGWSAVAELRAVFFLLFQVFPEVSLSFCVSCRGPRFRVLCVRRRLEAVALQSEWPFIIIIINVPNIFFTFIESSVFVVGWRLALRPIIRPFMISSTVLLLLVTQRPCTFIHCSHARFY